MSGLADYVKDLMKKGYDVNTIRANLVRYGYNPADINNAFNDISGKKPAANLNLLYIIGGGIALVVIVVILLIVLTKKEPEPPAVIKYYPIGVEIILNSDLVRPGSTLNFDLDVNSQNSQRANVTYEILDFKDPAKKVIIKQNDAATVEGSKLISKTISVASLKEGAYLLRVVFLSQGGKTEKTKRFDVGRPDGETPIVVPDKPAKNDTITVPTKECSKNADCDSDKFCSTDGACKFLECADSEEIKAHECVAVSDAGGDSYIPTKPVTDTVNINEIISLGKEDKEKAVSMCGGIADKTDKETCFSKLAQEVNDSKLCENLATPFTRDSCYANFALSMDFSVCDKIYDEYQKSICNAMAVSYSQKEPQAQE